MMPLTPLSTVLLVALAAIGLAVRWRLSGRALRHAYLCLGVALLLLSGGCDEEEPGKAGSESEKKKQRDKQEKDGQQTPGQQGGETPQDKTPQDNDQPDEDKQSNGKEKRKARIEFRIAADSAMKGLGKVLAAFDKVGDDRAGVWLGLSFRDSLLDRVLAPDFGSAHFGPPACRAMDTVAGLAPQDADRLPAGHRVARSGRSP